jgi:3-deoxy-manno-octulosonate cytidylyltransferase (CMP-KDO synthetase)
MAFLELANRVLLGVISEYEMMRRILGVIPARLESQRLPHKPMRDICGQPMIAWVFQRSRQAASLDSLIVATDAGEIFDYCRKSNIPAQMTSSAHRSGTDRIVEVMSHERADIYVNIQGDEPMITAEHIELLLRPFGESSSKMPDIAVSTLKVAIGLDEARSANNVKVVTGIEDRALYFSRALIPHDRDGAGAVQYYKHLGLYAYTAAALEKFNSLPPAPLEQLERLEQLRFLENGIPITVVETIHDTIGVDTEEDLQRVEEYFRRTAGAHGAS